MNKITELEKFIEDKGIVQISGGVFKDHKTRGFNPDTNQFEDGIRRANCTVESYCTAMGALSGINMLDLPILDPDFDFNSIYNSHAISGEEYAAAILSAEKALENGNCKVIIGECPKCCGFIAFEETHKCSAHEGETNGSMQ